MRCACTYNRPSGVLLRTHPTWPDIQSIPRKRKPPAQSRTGNEQIDCKELRQLQLWESCSHLLDTTNSSLELARDRKVQEPTQESTAQLRQIQRWLDESTLEEIQKFLQTQCWTGSTLLRTLNTSKLRHRQQQRRDRHHRQAMDETTEESRVAASETSVKAVTQWLTWFTEVEMHKTLRQ